MKSPWNQLNQLQCYVDVALKMVFYNHRLIWAISRQFFFALNGLNSGVTLDRVSNFQMCVVIRDLKVLLALPAAALPGSVPTELLWHIGSSRHVKACVTRTGWFSCCCWCLSVLRTNLKWKTEYWKKVIFVNGTSLIAEKQNEKIVMAKLVFAHRPLYSSLLRLWLLGAGFPCFVLNLPCLITSTSNWHWLLHWPEQFMGQN